jgi:hypothetical protein
LRINYLRFPCFLWQLADLSVILPAFSKGSRASRGYDLPEQATVLDDIPALAAFGV